jgi:hypothetical protein
VWKSRKFILLAVLAVVALAGSISGIVYAQEGGEDEAEAADVDPRSVLLERIAEKLGIDVEQLIDAVNEAVSEIRDEARLGWTDKVVEEGWLTAEEVQEYSDWWAAKPDIEFDFGGFGQIERHGFGGPRLRGGCGFGIWHIPGGE